MLQYCKARTCSIRQLLTVLSAAQVIKGFAAKSDGKDKLTALVQVRDEIRRHTNNHAASACSKLCRQQQLPWVQCKEVCC
jgi:hypothetical protein